MTDHDPAGDLPEMTATELRDRLDLEQTLVLVDVREAFERSIADLPGHGQLHIPLAQFPVRLHELDHDQPIVVYCRTGARSGSAVRFMQHQGYRSVWNLKGGVMAWREEVDPSLEKY